MKVSKIKLNKGLKDEFLSEMWENATFDNEIYRVLGSKVVGLNMEDGQVEDTAFESLLAEEYFAITTTRNRNLISFDQQKQLERTVVGFYGLSVGSHAALTWLMESRADIIKIADPDIISPSNLNRLRFGWENVGKHKTEVVAKQLQEIDPFTHVVISTSSDTETTTNLFDKDPKLDIIVDAMDDLPGKIFIRKFAKKKKVPVIMATDVGDNVFLDIERYDLDPQPEFFLGRVKDVEDLDLDRISDLERKKLIIKIVGFEKNSEQMLDSLLSLGKTLLTWPQLGATATIAGGIVATAIKKIILGEKVLSGRYYIALDDILVADFNIRARKTVRRKQINRIEKSLKIE